ncbi:MAG: SEC-C metal-binding domain-containing protein [Gammaproteobacteria bacterium]|nr:SEC-C metal-binding domain-containing protein [Gammaproteobacteria bacterium]
MPEHVHGPGCSHDHGHDHGVSGVETYRREMPKLGRNDPCHCGSGRKFKKCHGINP